LTQNLCKRMFLLPFLLLGLTNAFPSAPGGCSGGSAPVAGFHLSRDITTGPIEEGGFQISIDGEVLTTGTTFTISPGEDHTVTLETTSASFFRGFLIRIGETDVSTLGAINPAPDETLASVAAVCSDVGGIGHNSGIEKTSINGVIRFDEPASNMPVDVTVVVANRGNDSTFYFTSYSLTVSATSTSTSAPSLRGTETMTPSMAPTFRRRFPKFCFSENNMVETEGGELVQLSDLQIGDKVLVSRDTYDPVYSFGHRSEDGMGDYLQIHSQDTKTPLELSGDHMVLIEGGSFVPASHLEIGSKLVRSNGNVTSISRIRNVTTRGVYAPFTKSGTIVVNGVVASSYISYQDSENVVIGTITTQVSFQWIAHKFETIHRLACSVGSRKLCAETYTEEGVSRWVDVPNRFASWLWMQPPWVILLIMLPTLLILTVLSVIESWPMSCAVFVVGLVVRFMLMKKEQGSKHKML